MRMERSATTLIRIYGREPDSAEEALCDLVHVRIENSHHATLKNVDFTTDWGKVCFIQGRKGSCRGKNRSVCFRVLSAQQFAQELRDSLTGK